MIDKHLRIIGQGLILIALMLGVIAAALWVRGEPIEPRALARTLTVDSSPEGIPDSGRQRQEMITLLRGLSERMAAIEQGLKDGSYVIQVTVAKEGAAPAKPKEAGQ